MNTDGKNVARFVTNSDAVFILFYPVGVMLPVRKEAHFNQLSEIVSMLLRFVMTGPQAKALR